MRILHIDPDDMDNPVSGGGPVRTYEICRRLVARGHEVTILTPTFPGSTPEKIRDGIRYVRVGRRVGNHGSSHHITFFFQAPRMIAQFPHDLLVEDFMPPMGPTFTPWFARKPMVASVQWFSALAWQRQFKLPFVLGGQMLMRNYRNYVVLTDRMNALVRERLPIARVMTIPNAVSDHYFCQTPRYGDYILFVGGVARDKGVDLLLKAFARIPPNERISLVIAGPGWEFDTFSITTRRLGISKWVHFVGRKTQGEVVELYRNCRFVCVPSRFETFGLVIIEAQAAAKSVILFDQWPMNEVANLKGCLVIPPFDVDIYAEGMRKLLNTPTAELAAIGAANREFVKRYNWDASADAQEHFYLDILAAPARQ